MTINVWLFIILVAFAVPTVAVLLHTAWIFVTERTRRTRLWPTCNWRSHHDGTRCVLKRGHLGHHNAGVTVSFEDVVGEMPCDAS